MTKPKAARKVIVIHPLIDTAEHAIATIGKIETSCSTSATFRASTVLQAALTAVSGHKNDLVTNSTLQASLRAQLTTAEQDEVTILKDLDTTSGTLCAAVQVATQEDPSIAVGMGFGVKADRTTVDAVAVPTGLRVTKLKSGDYRIEFNESEGAQMYNVEMSVSPATPTSWQTIYGHGLKRDLPPVIPGQEYLFQVRAVASDGTPTAWSATVSFTGPTE